MKTALKIFAALCVVGGIFLVVSPFTITHDIMFEVKQGIFGVKGEDPHQALKYGRSLLKGNEQNFYDIVYQGIDVKSTYVEFRSIPLNRAKEIYGYYLNDTPEHFYVKNISFKVIDEKAIGMNMEYIDTIENVVQKEQNFEKKADEVIATLQNVTTDYEKSKAIYDYIVENVRYDLQGEESIYTAPGALLNGVAVCQGYAKAYQYLANKMGMQVLYVRGMSRGENHGWNIVKLEDKYYHVDTTWADVDSEGVKITDYSYLHVTQEEVTKDHEIQQEKNYMLPETDSISQGYYLKNNFVITDYKSETEKLKGILKESFLKGKFYLDVKFSDKNNFTSFVTDYKFQNELFQKVKQEYEKQTGKTLHTPKNYSVVKNEGQHIIKLIFQK